MSDRCDRSIAEGPVFFDGVFGPVPSSDAVVKMVDDLNQPSAGDAEKLREFLMAVATESFGDVPRHGTGSVIELPAKFAIIFGGRGGGYRVHLFTELVSQLPNDKFFDALSHAPRLSISRTAQAPKHPST